MQHLKIQVRPVKAGNSSDRIVQVQNPLHIPAHLCGGRGGIGSYHRAFFQRFQEMDNPQITGPEVLSPLGDAVGLIHRHKGNIQLPYDGRKSLKIQPFRSHIEDLISPSQ